MKKLNRIHTVEDVNMKGPCCKIKFTKKRACHVIAIVYVPI